jgi:hypothetical protein
MRGVFQPVGMETVAGGHGRPATVGAAAGVDDHG